MNISKILNTNFVKGLFLYSALYIFILVLKLGGSFNRPLVAFLYEATFFMVFFEVFRVAKYFGISQLQGKAFYIIALGLGTVSIGQLIWLVLLYGFNLNINFLSPLTFLFSYLIVFAGFVMEVRAIGLTKKSMESKYKKIFYLITVTVALIVFLAEAFSVFKGKLPGSSIFLPGFIIYDLLLAALSFLILRTSFEFSKGIFAISWKIIFASQILILIGNVLSTVFPSSYLSGGLAFISISILWFLGNIFLSLGFFSIHKGLDETLTKIRSHKASVSTISDHI